MIGILVITLCKDVYGNGTKIVKPNFSGPNFVQGRKPQNLVFFVALFD